MPKEFVTSYKDYFTDEGYQSLRTFLGREERGNYRVYTAPFADGESMSDLLSNWDKLLVSISREWPSLYNFEQEMRSKVGPLSIKEPLSKRLPQIQEYYDDILLPSVPVDPRAVKAVQAEFSPLRGMRLRSEAATVKTMKKSTNSGAPFFKKKRLVVNQTIPITSFGASYFKNEPEFPVMSFKYKDHNWKLSAVVGWRGQEGGAEFGDVKQRTIWMFPFSINIMELQLYQPFIEGSQKHNIVPAWVSMEQVDRRITYMFDTKRRDDLVVCTDFSRFDQHFNSHLQDAARQIISRCLMRFEPRVAEIFPMKYYIPIALEAKSGMIKFWTGRHGMASGSGGTNVDETLSHRALQYEAAISSGQRLNPYSQCLGDDGILTFNDISVEKVTESYESHGQVCNLDKQYASKTDCVYLRRWHHVDYRFNNTCVGVYPTMRALGRLRYTERYMNPKYWSKEAVALRQLSIIENVKYHPLKEQFVQFCMARDKYRLGIDIPGFLSNIEDYAKEIIDHIPDAFSYTQLLQNQGKGIDSWWIVNYLRSQS